MLQVIFHGVDRSPAAEADIKERFEALKRFDNELEECKATITKVGHQGLGEFLKGIAQNNHLCGGPQLVQKRLGAGQRINLGDGVLDLLEPQAVLLQDAQPPGHQLVVIRLIPGGAPQLRNAAGL